MKKLLKLSVVLAFITLSVDAGAEELGLKLANFNYNSSVAVKKEKSSSGGIHKGLVQFDVSFNMGGHGPAAGRSNYYYGYGNHYRVGVNGFRPGVTFNVDVAVHPYVSVGGYFGLDGGRDNYRGYAFGDPKIGIAVGARGVFHIYQLIADKANTKVDPGKLDFYFPLTMGGIIYKYRSGYHYGGFHIGAGVGLRYYFAEHVGVLMELGWLEMSAAKIGFSFKF